MSLLGDLAAYVDSLKRTAGNSLRDLRDDPQGLLSMRAAQLAESLPALPQSVMPGVDSAGLGPMRPTTQDWSIGAAMNAPTMGLLGHTVYHGSPHKFDKFDASKIGTGEGAQAYGHGLYFADNPATARTYSANRAYVGAAMNGKPAGINYDDPRWLAQKAIDEFGDAAKAKAHLEMVARTAAKHQTPETSAAVKGAIELVSNGAVVKNGALYKADLPDEWLPKMLDWDKPLSQQAPEVQRALDPIVAPIRSAMARPAGKEWGEFAAPQAYDPTGAELLQLLAQDKRMTAQSVLSGGIGPEVSARALSMGIPGVRYLDQGSRAAGSGTYNYVVFPGMEHLLKILSRE